MTTQQPTIVNSALRTKRLRIISKLGNVLIIAGVLTFGFSVSMYGALRIKDVPINQHHTSLIASFWIIATGILAVCTRPKSQGRGLVGTFNAFAITSIILAFLAFGTSVAGVVMYAKCGRRSPKNCRKSPDYGNVVYALLLALHLLEMAISIAATVYGFKVYNCCSHRSDAIGNKCKITCSRHRTRIKCSDVSSNITRYSFPKHNGSATAAKPNAGYKHLG
ncbi:uncharacterized protein LOC130649014 isoform X2 [Hydractinia symbiolongicarpus]|uniref:uncharacterized protein LOC130649014 isoform X2 n=1 Tax=Hydractinia symbiolongicarpus TaxID=13093 RepID=UPI00254BC5D5|nr:uncharacterized protein LOC130649014 isoform X2 [Hydractinia symbiolongicarpus]